MTFIRHEKPAADFRVIGLKLDAFRPWLFRPDAELAAHNIRRVRADRRPGFPCRISLQEAMPGESLLLLNYEHQPAPGPYRASHAIFIREAAEEAKPAPGFLPESLLLRPISLRAFDRSHNMVDADIATGEELAPLIRRFFADPAICYLQAHNAKPGCYAARIERVGEDSAVASAADNPRD